MVGSVAARRRAAALIESRNPDAGGYPAGRGHRLYPRTARRSVRTVSRQRDHLRAVLRNLPGDPETVSRRRLYPDLRLCPAPDGRGRRLHHRGGRRLRRGRADPRRRRQPERYADRVAGTDHAGPAPEREDHGTLPAAGQRPGRRQGDGGFAAVAANARGDGHDRPRPAEAAGRQRGGRQPVFRFHRPVGAVRRP